MLPIPNAPRSRTHHMKRTRCGLAVLAAAAVLVIASACATNDVGSTGRAAPRPTPASPTASPSKKANPGPGPSRSVTSSVERVRIVDTAFQPEDLTVAVRSTIVWKQIGLQAHSVTATDDSFDSSPSCSPIRADNCLGEGDDFSV